MKTILLVTLLVVFSPIPASASKTSETLSHQALSEDIAESHRAISALRELGPEGLESLLMAYQNQIERHILNPAEPPTPEWKRLSAALDGVSQQKDSYLSGLYWYTDLSQAEVAAKATKKPILSLRLLGNLNEEFSCANSRFFRTVLYSNKVVSGALRERFILHWQSVRPAPHITIDFGDGRKLERTITGNSIHYVLDADGHVIDALPGLYGPMAFIRNLERAENIIKRLSEKTLEQRQLALSEYHRDAVHSITSDWLQDAKLAGGRIPESLLAKDGKGRRAVEIAPLAVTKGITEFSILKAMTRDADSLKAVTDEDAWAKIAWHHISDAKLDDQSVGLIRRQMQALWGSTTDIKAMNLLQKLQSSIALDTVRNEYMLHTQLHAWLASAFIPTDVKSFNDKVYAELFLTPQSDPWLGLFSDDVYVGLEGGGISR